MPLIGYAGVHGAKASLSSGLFACDSRVRGQAKKRLRPAFVGRLSRCFFFFFSLSGRSMILDSRSFAPSAASRGRSRGQDEWFEMVSMAA